MQEKQIRQLACGIADALLNADGTLAHEIRNLSLFMDQTKREIHALRPKELKEDKIPGATHALDIISKTNEESCAKILSCAEALNKIAQNTPPLLREQLLNISTDIFEASTFDDLNGQRIRKVIMTFQEIEERLASLLVALTGQAAVKTSDKLQGQSHLEGPQYLKAATTQEEIDRLLRGL